MKKLALFTFCLLALSKSPAPEQSANPVTDSLKGVFGHHELTPCLRREHRVDQDKLRAHRDP